MNRKIKKIAGKLLAEVAYREAEKNANSTCVFLHGQPKMPESVKNLNKVSKKSNE